MSALEELRQYWNDHCEPWCLGSGVCCYCIVAALAERAIAEAQQPTVTRETMIGLVEEAFTEARDMMDEIDDRADAEAVVAKLELCGVVRLAEEVKP